MHATLTCEEFLLDECSSQLMQFERDTKPPSAKAGIKALREAQKPPPKTTYVPVAQRHRKRARLYHLDALSGVCKFRISCFGNL